MSNWPDLGCLELANVLKLETDLSPINHEFQITLLPLDACLREAASAKAGGRIGWG